MHNSLGEISHRFGKNMTETFLVRKQRSAQEIKKHPVHPLTRPHKQTPINATNKQTLTHATREGKNKH